VTLMLSVTARPTLYQLSKKNGACSCIHRLERIGG
jgi:hypothetical protein